jgi:hypothetical protein
MGRRIFFGFFAFASFVLTGAFLGGFLLRMFFVVLAFSVAVRGPTSSHGGDACGSGPAGSS